MRFTSHFKQNTEQIILRIRPQGSYKFCFHTAAFLRCAALKKGAGRREVVALKPNNKTNLDASAKETSLDCQLLNKFEHTRTWTIGKP
jgi:hypothetical protein